MLQLKKLLMLACCIAVHFISFSQGKIIVNGATVNAVNDAYVVTQDISVPGGTVNINKSRLKIAGSITSTDAINVTDGTVEMNGASAQTIPAGVFFTNKIKNLIIGNDVSLAGQDSVTGLLSFGEVDSKTFTTGGFLTLKSSANGTASVADLTNEDVNTGNQILDSVIVERYISAAKKWRLLSIPTNTGQTIKKAWQESSLTPNGNPVAGYGTQVTGPGGTAAGFDVYTATPSMKTYNTPTNTWITVPNTNSALINNPANNTIAYFVFVRGDRNSTVITSPVTPTVLRTKGIIKQSDQAAITIASPVSAFTVVGNPYPSPIDLRRMTPSPSTGTKIYVWDAFATSGSLYGLGAYQTLTYDGTDFSVTPGGGSYAAPYNLDPNYIESGQAFLVGGNSSPYTITFKEDIKPSTSGVVNFTYGHPQSLKANLFINKNGVTSLMDGIKADIGNNFSNYIDNDDAFKLLNSSENVSLKRNGQLLSVERHEAITDKDTFYINVGNMRFQDYQWQLILNNIGQPGLSGFFEDAYLHSSTPLSLNGTTRVDFKVENIPASYAPDRFRIVFTQLSTLPVTFTNVKAYTKNKDIAVEWKAENESNLKKYDVEKSVDGTNYAIVNTVSALNGTVSNYNWLDVKRLPGNNFYRILSTDITGKVQYSKVVSVFIGEEKQNIAIYPNPVSNGIINLQVNNETRGTYGVRLLNKLGQVLIAKQIFFTGSSTASIPLNKNIVAGIYDMEISKPDGSRTTISVSVLK